MALVVKVPALAVLIWISIFLPFHLMEAVMAVVHPKTDCHCHPLTEAGMALVHQTEDIQKESCHCHSSVHALNVIAVLASKVAAVQEGHLGRQRR